MEPTAKGTGGARGSGCKSWGNGDTPAAATPEGFVEPTTQGCSKELAMSKAAPSAPARRTTRRLGRRALATPAATSKLPRSPLSAKQKKKAEPTELLVASDAAPAPAPEVDADPIERPPQQHLEQPADVADMAEVPLQLQRTLPPEDSDDCSDDGMDADSLSADLAGDAGNINQNRGAASRVVMPVTSLAGKRHTRVVMGPGATSGASNGSGHHHGDYTLRYRTDLDKQVIHFMFERYQQEQAHPTISAAFSSPPSIPNAGAAEGVSGRMDESPRMNRSSSAVAHEAAAASSHVRARRINVEEICVSAHGDGDEKNIGLGDWHFFWMHVRRVRHTICSSAFRWQDQQIINHFPDHAELTRKDLMYKNIKRYLRENQGDNYARLTLHTATDWTSASANATDVEGAADSSTLASAGGERGRPLRMKSFCFADSIPLTYNIPNDMSMFKEKFQRRRDTQWIVKPTSRSQGKGIFLINDVRSLQRWMGEKKEVESISSFLATGSSNRGPGAWSSVQQQQRPAFLSSMESATANSGGGGSPGSPTSPGFTTSTATFQAPAGPGSSGGALLGSYIVSRYISNPLLIGGKKFDLRLYVLVTSYKPLVAYLHEDGFARFCATRYAGSSLAQEDLGSHLTNVALQKGDEHYNTSHGGKWSIQNLFLYLQKAYGPYAAEGMMKNIQFLIYHSLKAVEPVMFNDKHSYELYGYDILIDDNIDPHLIEVNASPSMSTTTVSDRLLKEQVLTDTMKIVFPPGYPTSNKGMPYWEYRLRTDLTTQQQTGFKLLQF
ncbi:tubulin_tyrosine_ligase (plasmid) [Leishmania braziliensis MHOM/BR/75/M2904]|uniref:Tubulin_tyrosine_ligase n=1 Tax=Leishmania braziliensis MHOM/BR/75/M2904 TaxID=420245 RepID=A0A3P3Z267_LEIBR|nr:tubulin_tyrosine_ligase [Leishmania braziliensis MHOM/BR/75/M2904]